MNYEKKYKDALELARIAAFNGHQSLMEGIFPELKESEDERIRKELIDIVKKSPITFAFEDKGKVLAWLENIPYTIDHEKREGFHLGYKAGLEKQGESYTKRDVDNAYVEGMACAKNELEKQGKQENAERPKFKVGDWVAANNEKNKYSRVMEITGYRYSVMKETRPDIPLTDLVDGHYHLWTIQDAKEGDILFQDLMGGYTFIYNGVNPNMAILYSFIISNDGKDVLPYHIGKPNTGIGNIEENKNIIHPATKEQRDILFQKMKESGYEWDEEKNELKKIEDEEYDGKDYGIDSLWHAMNILEKTLGKVNGYQTDDGFLSHQCAITAVKKLYKQKPTETAKWSAQEEYCICELEAMVREAWRKAENVHNDITIKKMQELMFFLKTLNPNKKPQRIISAEAKEALYNKPNWSEEDRAMAFTLMRDVDQMSYISKEGKNERIGWLNSLDEKFTLRESSWSEEDEEMCQETIDWFEKKCFPYALENDNPAIESINWLKSIKQKIKGE